MHIEHIAILTQDLERLRAFYCSYFGATASDRYDSAKGFSTYFLSFGSGARLEIMSSSAGQVQGECCGYAHLALSVGSEQAVDEFTRLLEKNGVEILSQPRRTGDGYYESVAADPDGNRIEITA